MSLIPFADRLRSLTGGRRLAVAIGAGAASVLALPPLFVLPVLLLTIPLWLTLLDGAERRRSAFWISWGFGFGYFAAGLYWIAHALLMDAARFGWMVPFAIGGLSAVLAVYIGLTGLSVHVLRLRGAARVFAVAGAWTLMEILRGILLTGFPWNPLGSVWAAVPPVLQLASLTGVFGLSLLTVLVAASPVCGRKGVAVAAAGLSAVALLGWLRLPSGPSPVVDGVRLRLVQPNIPQTLKWDASAREDNLRQYLALSQLPALDRPPTHILWGETAVPYALDGQNDGMLRQIIAAPLAVHQPGNPQAGVIVGAIRATPAGQEPFRIWNSMVALDPSGTVTGTYDKAHLVPFGEYVPYKSVLPLPKVTVGATDYSAGPGPATVSLPGLPPVGPLICYEVIFPGAVADPVNRPQWLLNPTNDGWYGYSTGPFQHLDTAVLRAVEEGLPVVRVANTGVSAVIDAYGRTTARIGLEVAGYTDADLPQAVAPTLFSRIGVWSSVALGFLSLLVGLLLQRKCVRPDAG
ncbi:apolipoprotein N-acyltransferase [Novispirillum itersonii]|uniref:Apolipoprotein N-acyltransferase n=1 Tax=Novispirillum itersonii TaxID=189 RepID=A0A7W9ZD02_NOVIT|nr:apolipoprotein N-acyltransferase [Novispirillum itersonii]MBB6209228.1 apolipoprotein N-acyltransferase [Novispirillum itersonii]